MENEFDKRKALNLGTTPRQRLSIRKELDDVALQSINEIAISKAYVLAQPPDSVERIKLNLEPNFVPQRRYEHRKSQPVLHETGTAKPEMPRPPPSKVPNVPGYNELDRKLNPGLTKKTKKYPYSKNEKITTVEMQKAKKSSMGVLPSSRQTTDLKDLNVMVEGQYPGKVDLQSEQDVNIHMVENANNYTSVDYRFDASQFMADEMFSLNDEPKTKPAILSQTGTTGAISLTSRPPPQSKKPSIDLEQARRRAAARERRLKQQQKEKKLAEEAAASAKEAEAERGDSESSYASVRSMQELVEEAENIAAGVYPKTSKSKTSKRVKKSEAVQPEKTVRNVDEIIASLKTQNTHGEVETEADRQIREIMGRVMKHANAVLGDIDKKAESPVRSEPGEELPLAVETEPDAEVAGDAENKDSGQSEKTTEPAESTPRQQEQEEPGDGDAAVSVGTSEHTIVIEGGGSVTHTPSAKTRMSTKASARSAVTEITESQHPAELLDLRAAYNDLIIAPQVTHEDIVSVHGKVKTFVSKLLEDGKTKQEVTKHMANVHDNVRSYVSKYRTATSEPEPRQAIHRQPNYERNVHYFCTAKHGVQMPSDMAKAVRLYHTPDQMKQALKNSWARSQSAANARTAADHTFQISEEPDIISDSSLARRRSAAARAILDEATNAGGIDYSQWRDRAQNLFSDDKECLSVTGTKTGIRSDETRTFWNTAPPKMSMRPATIRKHLFPEYYGAVVDEEGAGGDLGLEPDETMSDGEDNGTLSVDPEERQNLDRVLLRRHHSAQDLTHLLKVQMERNEETVFTREKTDATAEDEETGEGAGSKIQSGKSSPEVDRDRIRSRQDVIRSGLSTPLTTPMKSLTVTLTPDTPAFAYPKDIMGKPAAPSGPLTDDQIFPADVPKRSSSAPSLIELRDDFIAIPEDYVSAMSELDRQRRQIREMRVTQANREIQFSQVEFIEEKQDTEIYFLSQSRISHKRRELASAKPTLAEQALSAGRSYVIMPKRDPSKKAKKPVDLSRIDDIERFLYKEPNKLERCQSFYNMRKVLPERSLRVPQHVRDRRRGSVPDLLNWREYTEQNQMSDASDEDEEREWARDIWNDWFDEVYPPEADEEEDSDEGSQREEDGNVTGDGETGAANSSAKTVEKKMSARTEKSLISDEEFLRIESLDPLSDETEDEMMLREALEEEAVKVQDRMASRDEPLPFDHCRLGAIQRKLGQLKNARENLDKAVKMEPSLVHGYWQRHLLFLLQGKRTEALEDLNHILKINRLHAGAYISRAELLIYDDPTMAVTNLTQAIKIQPTNADIYMRRAKLYQGRDQVLLAMEDYAKAYKLNPKLTIAVFSRAQYYFKQNNWQAAINDFSEFLRKCPFDPNARLLRGQSYAKLGNHQKAVQDLSAAVHLGPNNWQAFYHRACIFRKAMPKQALLDYSMSVLINDSEDNIKSLLHRGVLYDALNQPEDAIADFEAILKLRKDVAVAHLNLGLIYLTKMQSYQKAIRKFSAAIKCDPTFVRAYICRAEAYTKIHDHKNALLDYTRAIHLRPEVPDYYMHRGMMLLKAGNTELAAFCVRHVSELFADLDLGQSATQQAVVHAFLKNYPKAIMALDNALRVTPNPPLYILLGKTQMKAKQWTDAIESFTQALQALKSEKESQILIHRQLNEYGLYQFPREKPWKPKDKWPKEAAEVNYLVGLCSLELRNYLQAHDAFNNAIEIDKKYAQAYYQRGVAKLRLKQHKGLQDVNRALAIDRTIFQAYLTRAAYYGARKQFSKAIMNCNEAIKLKPLSVRAHLYRGALKYHIKAYELAIKDLTQATKIDNRCSLAFFNRAVCYHDSRQYQKALTDYGIVLLLGDQLMLKVLINRGLLYLSMGDYKNALHDFLLAARVNSHDPKIRHTLGLCMHKLRKLKEAVAIFSEGLSIDKFFMEAYVSRGNAFLDYGNAAGIKAAQADYERALLLQPTYLPARINLAYSLQMCGKFQQAWSQFTTAIEQNPRCQAAFEGRAIVNLQMSNLFASLQDVNASLKIKSSAELHTNRGVISLFMKDALGAMHDFQAAIRTDPSYSLAYFNAANIYFKNRQFRQALAYYDRSIQFNSKDESAFVNRAITKAVIKDHIGALTDFSKALAISPKSAHIYFNRGNLHSTMGDWKKAEEDYSKALKIQPDDPVAHKRRADARGKLGNKEKAVEDYHYAVQLQARIKFLKSINTK